MAAETNFVEEKQKCHIYSLDTHICTFGLQWTIFIFLVLNWNKLTMEANEGGILLKTEMIPPPPPACITLHCKLPQLNIIDIWLSSIYSRCINILILSSD